MGSTQAQSFYRIDQALRQVSARLRSRSETKALSFKANQARENLRAIEETFSIVQEEQDINLEALLSCDARLAEAVYAVERHLLSLLCSTPSAARFLSSSAGELLGGPSGLKKVKRVRRYVSLLEEASSALGLSAYLSGLRQALLGLDDALRHRELLALTEVKAQKTRSLALTQARELHRQLTIQASLALPLCSPPQRAA